MVTISGDNHLDGFGISITTDHHHHSRLLPKITLNSAVTSASSGTITSEKTVNCFVYSLVELVSRTSRVIFRKWKNMLKISYLSPCSSIIEFDLGIAQFLNDNQKKLHVGVMAATEVGSGSSLDLVLLNFKTWHAAGMQKPLLADFVDIEFELSKGNLTSVILQSIAHKLKIPISTTATTTVDPPPARSHHVNIRPRSMSFIRNTAQIERPIDGSGVGEISNSNDERFISVNFENYNDKLIKLKDDSSSGSSEEESAEDSDNNSSSSSSSEEH